MLCAGISSAELLIQLSICTKKVGNNNYELELRGNFG